MHDIHFGVYYKTHPHFSLKFRGHPLRAIATVIRIVKTLLKKPPCWIKYFSNELYKTDWHLFPRMDELENWDSDRQGKGLMQPTSGQSLFQT